MSEDIDKKRLTENLRRVFERYFSRGGTASGSMLSDVTYTAAKDAAFEYAGDNTELAANILGTREGYVKCSLELGSDRNGNC